MDRQEAELRAELAGTGVSVTRDGDYITLNMPGNITFATDSADLNSGFFEVLEMPLEAGRPIADEDRAGQPMVVVVNEAFKYSTAESTTSGSNSTPAWRARSNPKSA